MKDSLNKENNTIIDLFNKKIYKNGNITIVGKPGNGKKFYCNDNTKKTSVEVDTLYGKTNLIWKYMKGKHG